MQISDWPDGDAAFAISQDHKLMSLVTVQPIRQILVLMQPAIARNPM
jgi:hypothetical protein